MKTIAEIIRRGILAGKTNEEILGEVYRDFPNANTKAASVSWYRSQLKRGSPAASGPQGGQAQGPKPPDATADPKTASAGAMAFVHGKGFVASGEEQAAAAVAGKADAGPLYTVASIKKMEGQEGAGFSCRLLRDGKHVATATDYGDGGPIHWEWTDARTSPPALVVTLDYKEDEVQRRGTEEEARFALYCRHLPKREVCGTPMAVSMDLEVESLVNDALVLKQLRLMTRNKIATVEDGKLYTYRTEPTPANIAKLKAKSPSALVLNELSEADAVRALSKLQD